MAKSDSSKGPTRSTGYFLLNTDGGMVNDGKRKRADAPGPAAIAGVLSQVRNGKERQIATFKRSIGPATNAEAEYKAFIEGMKLALKHEVRKIRIFLDSEFIVDQMNDRSRVQENMRYLHQKAHYFLHKFEDYRISWVPRERNADADALVKAVLSR